jgi:hypothetical protein
LIRAVSTSKYLRQWSSCPASSYAVALLVVSFLFHL